MGHVSRLLRAADEVACRMLKQRFAASCLAMSNPEGGSLLTNHVKPLGSQPMGAAGELPKPSAEAPIGASVAEGLGAVTTELKNVSVGATRAPLHSNTWPNAAKTSSMLLSQAKHIAVTTQHHPASARGVFQGYFSPLISMHSARPYSTGNRPSDTEQNEGEGNEGEDDGPFWDGEVDDAGNLYETIITEVVDEGRVGLITINRPDVLNALSSQVMDELEDALDEYDGDPRIKVGPRS